MSQALYRRYRPQVFADVAGQDHIKISITNAIASGNIAHAYLFSGPRAVGKTTMARLIAKAVNCLNRQEGQSEPCGECESCREIVNGSSVDVAEIDAASHTGVDNVRENIINNTRFTPTKSKFKVFIIDEVHMLSTSAFNALLKILEEPPSYVIFILATTELHKVPLTIVSRCQRFNFKKIDLKIMIERLKMIAKSEGVNVERDVFSQVAYRSEGCMRDAESLLGQILNLGGKEVSVNSASLVLPHSDFNAALDLFQYLINKNTSSAIKLINRLVEEGADLEQFIKDFIELLRKALLLKVNPELNTIIISLGSDAADKISELNNQTEISFILKTLKVFLSRIQALNNSFIPQLPLETAIVEICCEDSLRKINEENNHQKTKSNSINPNHSILQKVFTRSSVDNMGAKAQNFSTFKASSNGKVLADKSAGQEREIKPQKDEKAKQESPIIFLAQIMQKWDELKEEVSKNNPSVAYLLAVAKPAEVDGNYLVLSFKFKFQKERISDINNKKILEDAIERVYGVQILTRANLDPSIEINLGRKATQEEPLLEEPAEEELKGVLEVFGGSVVE